MKKDCLELTKQPFRGRKITPNYSSTIPQSSDSMSG